MHARRIQPCSLAVTAFVAAAAASSAAVADDARTRIVTMPYDDCTAIIAEAAQDLDTRPVTLTDTVDLRRVRIDAADRSVTISCGRSSNRMILSRTFLSATRTAPAEDLR